MEKDSSETQPEEKVAASRSTVQVVFEAVSRYQFAFGFLAGAATILTGILIRGRK
jgi:hypothetical protein